MVSNVLLLQEMCIRDRNELIQEAFNPKVFDKTPEIKSGNRRFRIGDRVLHTVNEDDRGVYNGCLLYTSRCV